MPHETNHQANMLENKSFSNRWLKPMRPRKPSEESRASTPLELLFDLVFVVAISSASGELHQGLSEHHFSEVLPLYFMVFFTIWWSWMNFTWFASAYDNDDIVYRLITFMQMIGSLILAAGVNQVFTAHDFSICVLGYFIMRLGLVLQWIRAGISDKTHRKTAFRYAIGIVLVQIGWIFYQFRLVTFTYMEFIVLAIIELCVPVWAEKANATTWHPDHIAERYGLLTIIVLGETIMASFSAIHTAVVDPKTSIDLQLICLMIGGMIIMFSIWWSYFEREPTNILTTFKSVFYWGYGHFFIYASIAAMSAGLGVSVEVITKQAEIGHLLAGYAIAIPLSIYSLVVWLIHDTQLEHGWRKYLHPLSVLLILLFPLLGNVGYMTLAMGVFYALCIMLQRIFLVKPQPST